MSCTEVIAHVMACNNCQKILNQYAAQKAGSSITKAKSEAARINGAKGGRPRKIK